MPPSSPSAILPSLGRSSPSINVEPSFVKSSPGTGDRTVLVVDDEAAIRNLTSLMLQRSGYKTLTATNGLEALFRLQEHPEVSIVVLDVLMPVMNGEEAFRQIRDLWPSVRVIVTSGLSFEDLETRFGTPPPEALLRKPFTLDTLAGAVAGALS